MTHPVKKISLGSAPSSPKHVSVFSALDSDLTCIRKQDPLSLMDNPYYHNHDGYEILLFLRGDVNYYAESQGLHLTPGDMILIPPYTFHCTLMQSDALYDRVLISIREPYLQRLCSEQTDLTRCFHSSDRSHWNYLHLTVRELEHFMELVRNLQDALEQQEYGSDLLPPALLTQLLVSLNRRMCQEVPASGLGVMPDMVAQAISYINGNLSGELSLQALGEHLHHNVDYIGRCFKAVTGTTLRQFIIAKRITLAQQYLRKGNPLCDACYLSGFGNYSHFSRCFTDHTGMSPKQYQKQMTVQDNGGMTTLSP